MGEIVFSIPARRARRLTIQVAARRFSHRVPSRFKNIGALVTFPEGRNSDRLTAAPRTDIDGHPVDE